MFARAPRGRRIVIHLLLRSEFSAFCRPEYLPFLGEEEGNGDAVSLGKR